MNLSALSAYAGQRPLTSVLAPLSVCVYLMCFALPLSRDVSLLLLGAFGGLAVLLREPSIPATSPRVQLPLFVFLLATALSVIGSDDLSRSIELSAPFLPGLFLLYLVADGFPQRLSIRWLYFTFCVLTLGFGIGLLWMAWQDPEAGPQRWVDQFASPIFVVPNDVTFLALTTPLAFTLIRRMGFAFVDSIAAGSVLVSVAVAAVFQSAVALLTVLVSLSLAAAFIRPRLVLWLGSAILAAALLVDGLLGFPMLAKFAHIQDFNGRLALWVSAWRAFLDAPWLGHGPHTFVRFYASYMADPGLPDWLSVDARIVPWAHNLFLDALAEQGVLGLASLLSLLATGLWLGLRTQMVANGATQRLAAGAFAALSGFCAASLFEITLLRVWVVIMLFVLLGIVARLSFLEEEVADCHDDSR